MEYTFREGKKYDRQGNIATPVSVMETTSSNGMTKYLAILWSDDTLTCNCPGWTILKKRADGAWKPRTCKHCKEAAKNNNAAMVVVDAFVPTTAMTRSPQLDFSERQPRKITLRAK